MKPRFRPVIRVFVSSTFSDLKTERNILQRDVFPRLEQYCLIRGFQFQAIDLRWGVPGEAGLDHRTMQTCFDELRRAQEVSPRPNFLVLLGDRYGWQPLAEVVTESEFQELEEAARQLDREASRDKQKSTSTVQVLHDWYLRDDNAVPPVYVLRSRHEWPDGQQFTKKREKEEWAKVEAVLWAVMNRSYPPERLTGRFGHIPGPDEPLPSIVKFQASATEQEIWRGALAVPDAPDHIVAWYRTIRNRDTYKDHERITDFFDKDATLHDAAKELKNQLAQKLFKAGNGAIKPVEVDLRLADNVKRLEVTRDHLATMCDNIQKKLVQIIEKEISEYWRPTIGGAGLQAPVEGAGPSEARKLELERQAHELFGESRAPKDSFVGREKELEAIDNYLRDETDRRPLVVYGPSGTGKTALLARAAQSAAGAGRRIFVRFLGTTPQSSNLRSLLTNLCRALRDPEEIEKEVSAELRELQNEFDQHLPSATEARPILLLLDALDQLDEADGARQTYWLRTPLPPHVKAVISCIYDPDGLKELNEPYLALERRKLLEGQGGQRRAIALESLPVDDAMKLLDSWLEHGDPIGKRKRRLTDKQRKAIETHIAPDAATVCRRPLYLRLLFEQCRLWASYKKEVKQADLGENTPALLQALFEHLAQPAVHGRILIESALGYLAAARHGLSENEILEVLWADPDYKQHLDAETKKTKHELPAETAHIPIAIWSRLRHDLDPYLAEHAAPGGAVLNFYHREVARVVEKHFLNEPGQRILRHGRLAKYFQGDRQPWWRQPDDSRQLTDAAAERSLPNLRKADELPHHLLLAERIKELVALLFDFRWLKVKIGSTDPHSLQQDFGLLLQARGTQLDKETRALLEQLRNFIGPLRSPEQLPTTVWGHFADTAHPQVRHLLEQARSLTLQAWLRPITPSLAGANGTLIQAITDTGHIESLAVGDTVDGDPMVVAITDWSPQLVRIWIDGSPKRPALPVGFDVKGGDQPITAINLPGDSRPALLLSWTDSSHGKCCSLLDLSMATFDVRDRIAESLSHLAVGHRDPDSLGPVMALGDGKPISVGRIAGRLVLLAYYEAVFPHLIGEDGQSFMPVFAKMSDRATSEWEELVRQEVKRLPESDYLGRLNRLAGELSSTMNAKISVFPKRVLSARAVVYDVETGEVAPRMAWSIC